MTSFYRFRPIKRLLGESNELESQTIYFASPDELNDPMEGLANVVFRGDEVVWENLFRHFAGCLSWAVVHLLLRGEEEPLTVDHLPLQDPFDSPVDEVARRVESLCNHLVGNDNVQALVRHVAPRTVSEAELRTYLKRLHQPWALEVLRMLLRDLIAGNLPNAPSPDLSELIEGIEALLVERTALESEQAIEKIFLTAEVETQKRNMRTWAALDGPVRPNHTFVHIAFVDHYLKGLRVLLHPAWYTACFMDDISNASVWGHYANGHRDVCLKFRATMQGERATLPLRAPVGWSNAGVTWSVTPIPFKPVTYSTEVVRLNFFTAMGNLAVPTLNKVWRVSRAGKLSSIEREVHGDEDTWRADYWKAFESTITTKQLDWSAEREHRLTLHSNINDLSDRSMRLLTYNFEDLEGIVFGMKTSDTCKQAIVNAVCQKCSKDGRKDFEFFQATRKSDGNGIDVVALGSLARE